MGEGMNKRGRPISYTEAYMELLETVFRVEACDRRALYDGRRTRQGTTALIRKAISRNHIKVSEYTETYGQRNRRHKFLTITGEGIACLQQHGKRVWCQCLPTVIGQVSLGDTRSPALAFATRCGNTDIIAQRIEATSSFFWLSGEECDTSYLVATRRGGNAEQPEDDLIVDYDDGVGKYMLVDSEPEDAPAPAKRSRKAPTTAFSQPLSNVKRETYGYFLMSLGEELSLPENQDFYFFPIREIRKMVTRGSREGNSPKDFSYGQYTGVLVGRESSLVLYHAKHDGMDWAPGADHRDVKVMSRFSKMYCPYHNINMTSAYAAIFIYNERNFVDVVQDKFKKRSSKRIMGDVYAGMSAVPITEFGGQFLYWLMAFSPSVRRDYVDSFAKKEGFEFTSIEHQLEKKVFRFEHDGLFIYEGSTMDVRQAINACEVLRQDNLKRFGIICHKGQEPYYQALWGKDYDLSFHFILQS